MCVRVGGWNCQLKVGRNHGRCYGFFFSISFGGFWRITFLGQLERRVFLLPAFFCEANRERVRAQSWCWQPILEGLELLLAQFLFAGLQDIGARFSEASRYGTGDGRGQQKQHHGNHGTAINDVPAPSGLRRRK